MSVSTEAFLRRLVTLFLNNQEGNAFHNSFPLAVLHMVACVWEKAMATHSSVLAWKIPWTEGPGGLPSMGSHRVGHD